MYLIRTRAHTHVYTPVMSYFRIWFHILSHCILHSSPLCGGPGFNSQPRDCGCPMLIAIPPLNSCVTEPWGMCSPDQVVHCQSCSFFCNSCFCKYVWENQVWRLCINIGVCHKECCSFIKWIEMNIFKWNAQGQSSLSSMFLIDWTIVFTLQQACTWSGVPEKKKSSFVHKKG